MNRKSALRERIVAIDERELEMLSSRKGQGEDALSELEKRVFGELEDAGKCLGVGNGNGNGNGQRDNHGEFLDIYTKSSFFLFSDVFKIEDMLLLSIPKGAMEKTTLRSSQYRRRGDSRIFI